MQTVDPLSARQWFTWKEPITWASSIAVFTFVFFMLTLFADGFLAFLIAFAVAFCVHFFVLDKRVLGIVCPHCGEYIETNTPWICGNKDTPHRNDRVNDFPFIHQCQQCGFIPKAYQCHHCLKLIFLSEDKQQTAYAKCADILPKPEPDHAVEKVGKQNEEKRDLLHELDVTKIKGDIKEAKSRIEPPPKAKTAFEELEEYYKGMMGNDDAAKKWHAAIDAEFPNDPDEREKRHRVVDQWMLNKT